MPPVASISVEMANQTISPFKHDLFYRIFKKILRSWFITQTSIYIYNMRPKKNTCINMYSQGKERQQNHHVHPFSPHIHGLCWFPASPPLRRPDKWAPPSLGLWTSMTCAAESGIRGLQIETAQKSSPQKVVFLATMWGPQYSVQLPYKWLNSMVYSRCNYSIHGIY